MSAELSWASSDPTSCEVGTAGATNEQSLWSRTLIDALDHGPGSCFPSDSVFACSHRITFGSSLRDFRVAPMRTFLISRRSLVAVTRQRILCWRDTAVSLAARFRCHKPPAWTSLEGRPSTVVSRRKHARNRTLSFRAGHLHIFMMDNKLVPFFETDLYGCDFCPASVAAFSGSVKVVRDSGRH